MLRAKYFSDRWISWIRLGLCSSTSSILINGIEGRKFLCKHGLRQGDPLSPFLFNLVADVFSRIINCGKNCNLVQGLGHFENGIVSLQYVDDTLLFSVPDRTKLSNLKIPLYLFQNASGLNINFGKSSAL